MNKHILLLAFGLIGLAVPAMAKGKKPKASNPVPPNNIVVGYQRGQQILFNTPPPSLHVKTKVYGVTNRVVLRKNISEHFAIESGINMLQPIRSEGLSQLRNMGNAIYSMPVTIQYYLVPQHCKVRPYCGMGAVYEFSNRNYLINTTNTDGYKPAGPQGSKYVSILFTQGMTFEVNTHIQVNESIHFIPQQTDNILGMDVGIGFKL